MEGHAQLPPGIFEQEFRVWEQAQQLYIRLPLRDQITAVKVHLPTICVSLAMLSNRLIFHFCGTPGDMDSRPPSIHDK